MASNMNPGVDVSIRRSWAAILRLAGGCAHFAAKARSAHRLRSAAAGLLVLAAFAGTRPCSAIEIEQVIWGFDGQVVAQRFNPLSVLVGNSSPEPFEGALRLQKQLSGSQPVDAPIEEPIFLSPFSSRWVQLYPYAIQEWEEWTLSWGRGPPRSWRLADRFEIPKPRFGAPARVLLDEPGALAGKKGSLKRFPEVIFPPTVTATDGLRTVVLDHAPRWEEGRRQAFLDWLRRGGEVHLVFGENGKFPEFSGVLAVLNVPLERHRVGAGLVFRHSRAAGELTPEFVRASILRGEPSGFFPADTSAGLDLANEPNGAYRHYGQTGFDGESFLAQLKSMTRADHNWAVIYLMSVVYIALIFPGCFLLGRRTRDYRASYVALLGTVLLFSFGFSMVGRRGYGEATSVHSVAIARPVAPGFLDVVQWSGIFVTGGDDYSISYAGSGALYSTCQNAEYVRGIIRNGADGGLLVDIPPYSARGLEHRIKIAGTPLDLKVEAWEAGTKLTKLVLQAGDKFPANPQSLYALYGSDFYTLSRDSGRLQLAGSVENAATFLKPAENAGTLRFNPWSQDDRKPEEIFRELLKPLIARSLNLTGQTAPGVLSIPAGQVRVYVYAPAPDELSVQDRRFGRQAGYVLYSTDLFAPESP